jgi:hypothetical protein
MRPPMRRAWFLGGQSFYKRVSYQSEARLGPTLRTSFFKSGTIMDRIANLGLCVCRSSSIRFLAAIVSVLAATGNGFSQDPGQPAASPRRVPAKDPPGMKRLVPDQDVWIDPANHRVVLDGTICLREGQLEMFACPKGTKEHESVVAVETKMYVVHAALLAVGAQPGKPVEFQPTYKPATGTEIEVGVIWNDADGVHRERAQNWVRNIRTGKPLEYPWVFAGSGFWVDETTGQKSYLAESGDFICVSNFASAMLDLPVESSQANDNLVYAAYTERIPPLGTRVRLVLTPKLPK